MKYTCEIIVHLPRNRVAELFDDPENLPKWLEGIEKFEHVSGEKGQPGAKSQIVMKAGKRVIEMEETIESRQMPSEFIAVYTTDGVWNRCEQYLEEVSEQQTKWIQNNEFRCTGLMMKLMTTFVPGAFRRETMKQMQAFKSFAEAS